MKAIMAIAFKTMRSAVRKKIAHVLLFFSALTVFVLPLTVKSDGTAKGLVQISITYTLGITGILLSLTAVWLGATLMSEDVEGYQIHMVVTKPVSRLKLMLGKWLGVIVLLGGVLAIDAVAIYGMCTFRLQRAGFSENQVRKLNQEVLIGRRTFGPSPIDLDKWARRELRDQMNAGAKLPEALTEAAVLDRIKSELSKASEAILFGQLRPWVFKGLPTNSKETYVSLRYRIFVEKAKNKEQRQTHGRWLIRQPDAPGGESGFVVVPAMVQGGTFTELHVPTEFISPKGTLEIRYQNLDGMGKTAVFQRADGPFLMLGSVSFLNNFTRVTTLLFFQIIFMATLGCAAGACLSTPMAVFMSFSYIFVGLLVNYIKVSQDSMDVEKSVNLLLRIAEVIGKCVAYGTFSLNEYVQIGVLTDGRLVEATTLAMAAGAMLFARALPIMLLGWICFQRRELGLVIRK